MAQQPHDHYFDNSQRSPGSQRQQSQPVVHRQGSRPFDQYSAMQQPAPSFQPEEHQGPNFPPRYPPERLNATLNNPYPAYETWNGGTHSFNQQNNNGFIATGATARINSMKGLPNRPNRVLPPHWTEPMPGVGQGHMPPPMGAFPGIDPQTHDTSFQPNTTTSDQDEELIPTAIVIKNIPFAVKKEQLVGVMTEMGLPLPYAFNYHFDQGVFRGLAFANFTTPEETGMVITALNHHELSGRKLRVEYKKMLPLVERERIEREKRIKRGQLEEQHRNVQQLPPLRDQTSLNSLVQLQTNSPSPVSSRPKNHAVMTYQTSEADSNALPPVDVDFNDPFALQVWSSLLIFNQDPTRNEQSFGCELTPPQRRTVHTIAHHFHLGHISKGEGTQRAVHVFRLLPGPEVPKMSPPLNDRSGAYSNDSHRRALARAATTDFSDVRIDGFQYGTLGRQSSGLLGFPDSPVGLNNDHNNLRSTKSYANLRSYTPSPAQSTASFPANLQTNVTRYVDYNHSTGASNPNLTSTALREDSMIVNGMGAMTLGGTSGGFGAGGSPRSMRNLWANADNANNGGNPGPIGSNRAFGSVSVPSLNDQGDREQRNAAPGGLPQRQPRGPAPERGVGFVKRTNANPGAGATSGASGVGELRHNGHVVMPQHGHAQRGSDELTGGGVGLVPDGEQQ